ATRRRGARLESAPGHSDRGRHDLHEGRLEDHDQGAVVLAPSRMVARRPMRRASEALPVIWAWCDPFRRGCRHQGPLPGSFGRPATTPPDGAQTKTADPRGPAVRLAGRQPDALLAAL